MAEKKAVGVSGHCNVCGLAGIAYQIQLWYLGHDQIIHDQDYCCRYELQRGRKTIQSPPEMIPNRITAKRVDEQSERAATPTGQPCRPDSAAAGRVGDATSFPADKAYQILVTDNHALPASSYNFLSARPVYNATARIPAQTKRTDYSAHSWLRDIVPLVPFRVIVRKLCGSSPVNLELAKTPVDVILEIKDPLEEFDQNDGRRRTFLEEFFNVYNASVARTDQGDDNADPDFGGARSGTQQGLPVSTLIRVPVHPFPVEIGYLTPRSEAKLKSTEFSEPQLDSPVDRRARLRLTEVLDNVTATTLGLTDFALRPPPIGGDNYRFLLSLRAGDQDVRERQENGCLIRLVDYKKRDIPAPRAYTTGRFIFWRRVNTRLVVLANETAANDIDWSPVRQAYEKYFMAMEKPAEHRKCSRRHWEAAFRSELGTLLPPDLPPETFSQEVYKNNFVPPRIRHLFTDPGTREQRIRAVARNILSRVCKVNAIDPVPEDDPKQRRDKGLYTLCVRQNDNGSIAGLGQYIGDRMLWVRVGESQAQTARTLVHELGHALYLRHSHLGPVALALWDPDPDGGPNPTYIAHAFSEPPTIDYIFEHDQADAFDCVMSQESPVDAVPCGMCGLLLRFYDRKAVVRSREHYNTSALWTVDFARWVGQARGAGGAAVPVFRTTDWRLSVNARGPLRCVAMSHAYPLMRNGNLHIARVNLTMADGARWEEIGTGHRLSIQPRPAHRCVEIRGLRRGTAQVRFSLGKTARIHNTRILTLNVV